MLAGGGKHGANFYFSVPRLTFSLLAKKKDFYIALCFYQIFVLMGDKGNNNMD